MTTLGCLEPLPEGHSRHAGRAVGETFVVMQASLVAPSVNAQR